MSERPRVWIERMVLPELRAEVESLVTALGPSTLTPDDPFAEVADAAGIIAGSLTYGADVMARAPNLKVIARGGIGVDGVDLRAATERGVAVCNVPDGPTVSTAEHAIALIGAVTKNVLKSGAQLRRGETDLYARHRALELDTKVLGLVGCGRIARRVARIGLAFGMTVTSYDPFLDPSEFPRGVARVEDLPSLLAKADVVSVHIPLTDESRHLFNDETFRDMKPGAAFINTARGGIVDHDALLVALESGLLMGAGLDVTDPEPLPPDHPLLNREDVVVTAHIASATPAARTRILRTALVQVLKVLEGTRPPHLVNPEVWD